MFFLRFPIFLYILQLLTEIGYKSVAHTMKDSLRALLTFILRNVTDLVAQYVTT